MDKILLLPIIKGFCVYMLLLLFLSLSLKADWQDVQHRISCLANEKNKIILKPALLCDNDTIDDMDATLVVQVRTAFKEQQYGTVESLLKDVDHPQAFITLGILNFGSQKGVHYLQSAAEKYQSFDALFNLGMHAYVQKNIGQAIQYFEQAQQRDTCGLAHCFLGMVLQAECVTSKNSSEKALEHLKTAAYVYHVPEALALLGQLYQLQNKTHKDSPEWRILIDQEERYKNYPAYSDILFRIGMNHYIRSNQKPLAYEYLHKAVDSYNHNPASYSLGIAYLEEENYRQACTYLERCKAANDKQENRRVLALAIAYLGYEQYDKASELVPSIAKHFSHI